MSTRKKKTSRRKTEHRVVIDGPEPKKRPVRKTIYLSEEHAYKLSVLAAMSSLNGRKLDQSGIVEDALDAWFDTNSLPNQFEVKLNS